MRDCLGRQDIEVYGIDPRCRVAHVLVEADYHMKLIGMGLVTDVEPFLRILVDELATLES